MGFLFVLAGIFLPGIFFSCTFSPHSTPPRNPHTPFRMALAPCFFVAFFGQDVAAGEYGNSSADQSQEEVRGGGEGGMMEEEIRHRMESIPEGLVSTLYPFQLECVKFAIRKKGRMLLGT